MSSNHQDQSPDSASQDDTETLIETKTPSLYKVILLNDDFTPMDFVVYVLKRFFNLSDEESERIMLEVHHKGAGLAGVFTKEIAESKTFQVNQFSQKNKYPLKTIMEAE